VPSGAQVPLHEVANVEEVEGVNQIQRENTRRRVVLGFNVGGRDVQGIVQELQQKVGQQLKLPAGYRIVYGGSFENLNAAKERLSVVVPVALLMIFLLLYFAFRSVKQGLLVYTAIPLSAIGGVLALWLRGMPFSISAGVGFIALFGVAVLNGILLVTECNRLRQEGWQDSTRIVLHATKSKLRAVLMTALVPALGFIPMALSTGAGGEVQKPLATVVIGGLIVSTLLTLFVLPLSYVLMERRSGKRRMPKAALLLLPLLYCCLPARAQQLSLAEALQQAESRHAGLEAARLSSRYYHELVRSAVDLPYANVNAEYGKINSAINDNRFAVSQSIPFPSVLSTRKKVFEAQAAISDVQTLVQSKEVAAAVKSAFYALRLLREQKQMLQYADSIYAAFAHKAAQQFELGATDILEKTSAENQRAQIAFQLQQLQLEEQAEGLRLQYLLRSAAIPEPQPGPIVYRETLALPDTALAQAPQLQKLARELMMTHYQQRLERNKLLPAFSLGYSNMSIIGWQTTAAGTEQYYNGSQRFSTVNVGIEIPLFFQSQRARIRAAATAVLQKEREQEQARLQLLAAVSSAASRYRQLQQQLLQYRNQLLPNATLMLDAAGLRLDKGEIDYLQWTLLVNQALGVRSDYYKTVQQLNELVFELEKNTGNNN
jgi:cobalt-zinc-cadmium resistance protein CzcA